MKAREINWVNVGERCLATMAQAFLAAWTIGAGGGAARAAAIAAVAAGLSVVKNAVTEWASNTEKV